MMCKILFGLIYVLDKICSEDFTSSKRKLWIISDSEIRAKRQELEQRHYADYKSNEVVYRNWPEVQQNPKYDCQRFLQMIMQYKVKVNIDTAEIRKVILNYTQIRDKDGNILTAKRVTALQCRLSTPMRRRTFIFFIRSPQSPKCALFLNRVRKRSFNVYIAENVCEHQEYNGFWNYAKELKEDTFKERTNIPRKKKRQLLQLSDEESRIKRVELEQKHYEYCLNNEEVCKLWPEILVIPENVCQKFLKRMLSESQDISLITEKLHEVTLHYLELRDENQKCLDPVIVNAIACRLPQSIENRNHVFFIRAPSYPSCVFYGKKKVQQSLHLYITEEICDTPNHKTSLYRLHLEHVSKFGKKIKAYAQEASSKLHTYEELHFKDYLEKSAYYEQWPELEDMNITSYCQTLIEIIFSQIKEMYDVDKFKAFATFVKLKYATMNETNLQWRVKAVECRFSGRQPPNRFLFIRAPIPDKCVYWVRLKHGRSHTYFIVREICK